MERLIRRDPARRGLIASEESRGVLCPGHLAGAATDLSTNGRRVAIVTGFYIPGATPPAAETDGPPGAALLGAALTSVGMSVQFVTDEGCRSAVEVAVAEMGLAQEGGPLNPLSPRQSPVRLAHMAQEGNPFNPLSPRQSPVRLAPRSQVITPGKTIDDLDRWFASSISDSTLPPLTHLIAIERVGPSHSRESIRSQVEWSTRPEDLADFERLVPASDWNRTFNMRGVCLDEHTAPLHRLFELAGLHNIKTIGIGDGGNEIGMGSIAWGELRSRLQDPAVAKIPCRIATDWTIVAGVSNWGGMALAASTLLLLDRQANLQPWTAAHHQRLLERLVEEGPAVDGITRLASATVDGLPFVTYIQPWEGIRRVVGLV